MFNNLKLAKNKSRKYKLLAIILAIKILLSILAIMFVSYLAINAEASQVAL